jgi:mono/diheme cytochrome c family protein
MSEKNSLSSAGVAVPGNHQNRMNAGRRGPILPQRVRLVTGLTGGAVLAVLMGAGGTGQTDTTGNQRQIDRGRYVVRITGCNDCHTAGYAQTGGKLDESHWLTGDQLGWHGPWGTTYAVNLRLLVNSMTEEQWVLLARNAQPRPPMPWWSLRDMSQEDLKALYAYVKWLGPAGEPAPSSLPPGQEPAGPVVQFPN